MRLQFIGCGDALARAAASTPACHVTGRETNFLIDCGATSLPALKHFGVARDPIDLILITHFHGDRSPACRFCCSTRSSAGAPAR